MLVVERRGAYGKDGWFVHHCTPFELYAEEFCGDSIRNTDGAPVVTIKEMEGAHVSSPHYEERSITLP
ncbi:hypothetical protein [Halobacillus dabanensis]|uniref:hypothetical protein n=1 Tax=Halobacillus dabanensis TaxID=240302 RepID=UPI0011142091|nr:hypothetical protein [Halobacillus dabanensis]